MNDMSFRKLELVACIGTTRNGTGARSLYLPFLYSLRTKWPRLPSHDPLNFLNSTRDVSEGFRTVFSH